MPPTPSTPVWKWPYQVTKLHLLDLWFWMPLRSIICFKRWLLLSVCRCNCEILPLIWIHYKGGRERHWTASIKIIIRRRMKVNCCLEIRSQPILHRSRAGTQTHGYCLFPRQQGGRSSRYRCFWAEDFKPVPLAVVKAFEREISELNELHNHYSTCNAKNYFLTQYFV